jgi:hypothetical protein
MQRKARLLVPTGLDQLARFAQRWQDLSVIRHWAFPRWWQIKGKPAAAWLRRRCRPLGLDIPDHHAATVAK